MQRLEKSTPSGGKFWEVGVKKAADGGLPYRVERKWGKVGTGSKGTSTPCASQTEALQKATSWRDAKVQQGYHVVSGDIKDAEPSTALAKPGTPEVEVVKTPAALNKGRMRTLPPIPKRAKDVVEYEGDLSYETDKGVRYAWRKYVSITGREDAIKSLEKVRPGWSVFAREVFGHMLDGHLDPVDGEPVDWAAEAHRVAETLPEYHQLAEISLGDRFASGSAAISIAAEIGRAMIKQPQNGLGGPGPGGMPDEATIRSAVRRAAREAADRVEDQRQAEDMIMGGWGHHRGQPMPGDGLKQKAELAELIKKTPKFKEIMDLAGKMRDVAQAKRRTRRKEGMGEIVDVGLGADIARILPAEIGLLNHPIARLDLLRRLSERRTLQYEMEGREKVGRGPIVLLLDCSGSMSGGRDVWSKALAMATLSLAAFEKRAFMAITYDTNWRCCYEVKPGDKYAADGVFRMINEKPNGGTDWARPLTKAKEEMGDGVFTKADVLMITDGECSVSGDFRKKWRSWCKRNEVDAHGYLVNERYRADDYGDDAGGPLASIMTAVTKVSDLSPSSDALQDFFSRVVNH